MHKTSYINLIITAGIILIVLCSTHLRAQKQVRSLSDLEWKFRNIKDTSFVKAGIPGSVHTDLLATSLISDPFYGTNEKEVQWIEKENWEYRCEFNLTAREAQREEVILLFEGLDTYADVYLNNSLLFSGNNMFRSYEIPVKHLVRKGKNHLQIIFHPPLDLAQQSAKKISYTLPGEERVFVRKAQYQFGWDWGPRLIGCGIWKDIKLITFDDARILETLVKSSVLSDTLATVLLKVNLQNSSDDVLSLNAVLEGDGQIIPASSIIRPGEKQAELRFTIPNPRLWWCKGLGEAYLYSVKIQLREGKKAIDGKNFSIGLRTIELVQEADSIGSSFYFKLNGIPVFMKGANWIPADFFPHRMNLNRYESLINAAARANINMLRVWGGGIYESDEFYDLCDKYGILVWQDFMFACAMYPADSAFLNTVSLEAEEQIIRLRNHPSLAIWCGNNENIEGWYNWGWQKQYGYSEADSVAVISAYKQLFEELLPSLVKQHDVGRFYHPSSPANGWGREIAYKQGDVHYWGVWWGMEPFNSYRTKTGRFVSEYGFQGMPAAESFKQFIPSNEFHLKSASVKAHQKHPTGYETIIEYMSRDFPVPDDFADFIYVSQLLQAEGIKTAIHAHRKAMPKCMGSLFWQLNDCWPVTSWSAIDYYERPKALYYQISDSFKPLLLLAEEDKEELLIHIISDENKTVNARLSLALYDFNGKAVYQKTDSVNIAPLTSTVLCRLKISDIFPANIPTNRLLLQMEISSNNLIVASAKHYFVKPAELNLKLPLINIDIINDELVLISCEDYLAKDIYLECEGVTFSENFFDLLPGESMLVRIQSKNDISREQLNIQVKTLNNIISHE